MDKPLQGDSSLDIRGVIFFDHTPDTMLAKKIRMEEVKIAKVTSYRVKVVKKAGDRLDRLLIGGDSHRGNECMRESCRRCWSKQFTKKKGQPCSKGNLTYKPYCLQCIQREIKAEYIGETG